MSKPKPPATLAPAGKALWSAVVAKYDLRVDELVTLEDYCAMADEIAEIREAWIAEGRPRHTKGSMGQLIDHPDPKKITDLRMKRAALSRQLKLPDDATAGESNQNRSAANSRWAQAHGAGA